MKLWEGLGRAGCRPLFWWAVAGCLGRVWAGEFTLAPAVPTLDKWMYPFVMFSPPDYGGERPVAPTFASFDPRFDTRDGQFLLGWDTADLVAPNAGPRQYLVRRARVTLTISADLAFVYDPTYDSFLTYDANLPGSVSDADAGRPVELYGAGFRNGFTAATFTNAAPYGGLNSIASSNISIGTRNAFAAMFGTNGTLIDIANNVGQTNAAWTAAPFEVRPWAVGQTTNAEPGELVPSDAKFTFDLDLSDPQIIGYLQAALDEGRLRLFISSLSPASQVTPGGTGSGGTGAYPQWATKENLLYDPAALELEGTLVGATDADADGLPDDWEQFYFRNLDALPDADPDTDGATNAQEFAAGTDPAHAASVFRVVAARYDGSGNATLQFTIAPSRTYRVEFSSDLLEWNPANGTFSYPQPGIAEFREEKLNVPPGLPPQAFYRVLVE